MELLSNTRTLCLERVAWVCSMLYDMIIHLGGLKFLLIGWGFQVWEHTLSPKIHLHRVVAFRREDGRS